MTLSLAELLAQEESLILDRFTEDDAWWLGSLLVSLARERELPILVDIRRGERQLFAHARPGTVPDNAAWIARKCATVRRFGRSSLFMGQKYRDRGTTFEQATGLPAAEFAAHGGAFPIAVRGAGIIGTVAVSGLAQTEDHALVVEALGSLLAAQRAGEV
ncbi:heme-degrading domain-containing protein [Brachybacterium hainanense]|uniref:UPF0303 protein ACFFF6_18340 n=1 Tax=Brachybacterium hainanense TaxID=1541174 RepID=A0ABV6RG19_9MICO